jgi:hypothetical protein
VRENVQAFYADDDAYHQEHLSRADAVTTPLARAGLAASPRLAAAPAA